MANWLLAGERRFLAASSRTGVVDYQITRPWSAGKKPLPPIQPAKQPCGTFKAVKILIGQLYIIIWAVKSVVNQSSPTASVPSVACPLLITCMRALVIWLPKCHLWQIRGIDSKQDVPAESSCPSLGRDLPQ